MNQIIQMPQVGQRDGGWVWDGTRWVCDGDGGVPTPCPPFGPPVFSGPTSQPPWYPGANGGISFGTQPPANPVRGHLFYDGKTLWLFDGAAWVSIGGSAAGAVVTPPGTTFPTNPVAGQQFFDGTNLWIWDGNAWVSASQTKTYIQATAPPAPKPGDTWWNGTQFYVWNGSAWEIVGPGASVGPVPTTSQVFSITTTTGGTVAANQFAILPINGVPTINTQGSGTWNINTHQWTPNVAGTYFIECLAWLQTSEYAILNLVKNDSGAPLAGTATATIAVTENNQAGWMSCNGMAVMNGTTDFLRLWWFSVDGVYSQSYGFPTMRMFLLP